MISMTEKAAEKVKEIATAEDLGGQGLRLRVVGGGCSGFTYDLYFEDNGIDGFQDPNEPLSADELKFAS